MADIGRTTAIELDAPISFLAHQLRTGSIGGARSDFEQMITQLVCSTLPTVRQIEANPGDWGIDAFVGSLDDGGTAAVWQSKYFVNGVERSQQEQIRESFAAAVSAAAANGYGLSSWTLCLPCSLTAPATKWWDSWRKKKVKEHPDLIIDLWDETQLRRRLLSPEGDPVRRHYFGREVSARPLVSRAIHAPPEDGSLEGALFLRQLRAARHVEFEAAKREFFNAELMAREVLDKGVREELQELLDGDASIQSLWEHRFNASCGQHCGDQLPGLHRDVMADVNKSRGDLMASLAPSLVHLYGMVHRVVEDRRAGWVRYWRDVADAHILGGSEDAEASELEGTRNDG